MSRLLFFIAFAIGLAVVAWVGQRFLGSDLLAVNSWKAGSLACRSKFSLRFRNGLMGTLPRCPARS